MIIVLLFLVLLFLFFSNANEKYFHDGTCAGGNSYCPSYTTQTVNFKEVVRDIVRKHQDSYLNIAHAFSPTKKKELELLQIDISNDRRSLMNYYNDEIISFTFFSQYDIMLKKILHAIVFDLIKMNNKL